MIVIVWQVLLGEREGVGDFELTECAARLPSTSESNLKYKPNQKMYRNVTRTCKNERCCARAGVLIGLSNRGTS